MCAKLQDCVANSIKNLFEKYDDFPPVYSFIYASTPSRSTQREMMFLCLILKQQS